LEDQKTYGRLYNTRRICQILVLLTICTNQDLQDDDDTIENPLQDLPLVPLPQWSAAHWETFKALFEMLQTDILRKDAAAKPWEPPDDSVHAKRARSKIYNDRLFNLLRYMQVQKILSPVHADLLKQIKGRAMGKPAIAANIVQDLW
jgi:hypothetical protein